MDFKKRYGIDAKKERDGVWCDLGDGLSVKVARLNSPEYLKAVRDRTRGYHQQLKRKTLPAEVQRKITAEVYADAILLDWKGLVLDGKETPYSRDKAVEMLLNFPVFADDVTELADDLALFREEEAEDSEKNSPTGSASSSDTPRPS